MKALLALALLSSASAMLVPYFNPAYIKLNTVTLQCEIQTGYAFRFFADAAVAITATEPTDTTFAAAVLADPNTAMATQCRGGQNIVAFMTCATGYHLEGQTTATQTGALANGDDQTATGWEASMITGIDAAVWETPYDFATDVLTCVKDVVVPIVCNYTCTGNCINASGSITPGTQLSTLCQPLNVDVAAIEACPVGGLNTTTAVVCTHDPAVVPAAKWFELASQYPGYSIPQNCGCLTDPVCPDSITCSQCYLDCNKVREEKARQAVFAAAVFCPVGTTTIEAMKACFLAGACAGAIQPGDICVYGPLGAGVNPCPTCGNGSKKGLLGLLGLLGIIPLVLCSLCCSLLLCLIRRKKKERDVHFATFDAGAPIAMAPVAEHCHPVATTHSHVHHATYVGAPHVDPGCIAY